MVHVAQEESHFPDIQRHLSEVGRKQRTRDERVTENLGSKMTPHHPMHAQVF